MKREEQKKMNEDENVLPAEGGIDKGEFTSCPSAQHVAALNAIKSWFACGMRRNFTE